MRLLLDTHVFLWFIGGDRRLLPAWQESIRQPANEVFLSVVSLWESMVKYHLGKLALPRPPADYLPPQRERHRIASLPLDESSVKRLAGLLPIHRDPFDRMLICQALEHGLTIVTLDEVFRGYSVPVLRQP